MSRRSNRAGTLLALAVLGSLCLLSHPASAGSLSLLFENDSFADSDHHYTSGLELLWTSSDPPSGLASLGRRLPLTHADGEVRAFLGLGQSLFTPHDIEAESPPTDERPYAGWLYLQAGLLVQNAQRQDRWDLALGVVGPAALGEQMQAWVHDWSDSRPPAGWEHQLSNEPGAILSYRRGWDLRSPSAVGWGFQLLPFFGGSLGNVHSTATGGLSLCAGRNLDAPPPRVRPAQAGSSLLQPQGLGIQVMVGLEGQLVARNIFLDGNSFRDGPAVEKRWTVGEAQAGLALLLANIRLSYVHLLRSAEYRAQQGPDDLGSLVIAAGW